jgi:transcriptional regulator with XRE-family HTH domain
VKLDSAKVRWHRDRLGWTLDTLAEKAEVAEGTALRAEHGEDIRPSSGRRIARALGVDVSELVPDRPGVVLPKAAAVPNTPGPRSTEKPPRASKERLEEYFDDVVEAEVAYLNETLADLWRLALPGEKPEHHFVPENIDTDRVWHYLNKVLTTPNMFTPEATPEELERFNRGARKTAVVRQVRTG